MNDTNKLRILTMQELDELVEECADMANDVGQLMADDYFNIKVRQVLLDFYRKDAQLKGYTV